MLAVSQKKSGPIPSSWQPPTVEELQIQLPGYAILRFLSHGGMGAVFLARQTSLDRLVALKILRPDLEELDPGFGLRFQQEAQTMARLSHPNIVAVHDAGGISGNLLYFVMEYIEGTDVAALIATEGFLSHEHAVEIAKSVCEALIYAHGEGIIHRDIKPSNILITTEGKAKVADFGLAKPAQNAAGLDLSGTWVLGTAEYMAPERLEPGGQTDHRADIFAVGVMLYQMLTGKMPRGRFQLPSEINPRLDPRLDAIVHKALQPDKEKRQTTAIELRDELVGLSTELKPVSGFSKALKLAALIVGVASAGSLWYLVGSKHMQDSGGPPSAPTAQSTTPDPRNPALKPGEWIKLSETLHHPRPDYAPPKESGTEWRLPRNAPYTLTPNFTYGKNMGAIAIFRREKAWRAGQISLRKKENSQLLQTYVLCCYEDNDVLVVQHHKPPLPNGRMGRHLKITPIKPPLKEGECYLLAMAVVGDKIYSWINNQELPVVKDSGLTEGVGGIHTGEPYRQVEFVKLDGLGEEQALALMQTKVKDLLRKMHSGEPGQTHSPQPGR